MEYYPSNRSLEIDLREELNKTLYGSSNELAKGQFAILRRMRRKDGVSYPISEENLQKCPCTENPDLEADRVVKCQWCYGERFLFDDEFIVTYRASKFNYVDMERPKGYGNLAISLAFFYCEHTIMPSRFDKIIEPMIDYDGNVISPIEVKVKHNIEMADAFRSDNGRIEFWRLGCIAI